MNRSILMLAILAPVAACATPETQFIPSQKSAVELRSIQARTVPVSADTAMRGIVATLHDLGYRITRVESDGRTISATRSTTLRMAVVVQPRSANESTVRANATMIAPMREAQIDSAEFYRRNFFEPLSATMNRSLAEIRPDDAAPEAVRPVAEVNTARERETAARMRATPVSTNAAVTAMSPVTGALR